MGLLRITYETWDEQSLEIGETDDKGWIDEDGTECDVDEVSRKLEGREPTSTHFHTGVWYRDADGDNNSRTGEVTYQSYHLSGFTPAEEKEIFDTVTRKYIGILR